MGKKMKNLSKVDYEIFTVKERPALGKSFS